MGSNKTYNVGPGKTYTELTDVPWLSLQAGDVVNIFYRSTPYRTKFGLRAQGTAAKPVYINGVTDESCNRPVIDGENAVTATDAKYGTNGFGAYSSTDDGIQPYGLILIYWKGDEMTDARNYYVPKYITIQNLKLTNARSTKTFKNARGLTKSYLSGVGAIYAVRVQHLTVENCEITENDNGVFTNTRGQSTSDYSSHIIFRRNKIHYNGNSTHSTEHNLYIQAKRTLYEGNFLGQARGGATLKDRSSGTVVRYNYIQSSIRALDLVDSEEEDNKIVRADPLYDYAWVYGNAIVTDINLPLSNSASLLASRPIHFGHDKNPLNTRKGTLFYYGNTHVHRTNISQFYYTNAFQVGGNDDDYPYLTAQVEASGNIFWNDDGSTYWYFIASNRVGRLSLKGTNYVPTNWDPAEKGRYVQTAKRNTADMSMIFPATWTTTTTKMIDLSAATLIVGDTRSNSPQLNATTLVPTASSPVLNKGINGPSFTPTGATAANLVLQGEYTSPIGIKTRVMKGTAMDLGAFEGS
ncbi:hypothetical protein [Aquabacterium sp.]|uniref:hypothetical protein n=1 Tax=Aquabacterium sp. TaxID=1872578 RepID=UPI0025C452E6|nr:hypothetical protein [Aquabacterium sp.]